MNNQDRESAPDVFRLRVDDASGNGFGLRIMCLCFMLSGVAALIYQTVWARQFALVFGTSELAIAAVLAAYMGGLALGAWLIEKRIGKVNRPVRWYAAIEVGIAAAALLLVPAGLWIANRVLEATFGGQSAPPSAALGMTSVFYLAAAFAVLLIPTTLMGATLPLLARHAVHNEQQIGRRIGLLYACNTLGAVAGALLGALVLLPRVGLGKTIWVAAAVNVLVAALAMMLERVSTREQVGPTQTASTPVTPERMSFGISAAWVLPLMCLSGAVSFLHEVLWTRMLSHVLGSSIYAFGVMLASFLAGIALGGGLGALLARGREAAARWLAISELGAAVAAAGAWYALQKLSPEMELLSQRVGFGFALLFPLAFAIGLTYPLSVRVLSRGVDDAALASARVYSWNTVGAILGAIAGGFLIVPAMRYEGSVRLAVIGSCLLSVSACFVLFKPGKRFAAALTAASLAVCIVFAPKIPDALLRYSPLRVSGKGEMLYYDVGRSAAVVTLRLGDQIAVRTNGLPEAAIDIRGTVPQLYAEAWMAPLAVLARPNLQDMLVIGFGGGRVVEAVPPSVQHVDVIELEDKVLAANRQLTEQGLREPAYDPLRDARVNMIVNDARGALQLTDRKYDAIVSQPSHPWTAGASHLYTREFMQQARAHLNPGGVFVQWMNADFLDESLLRSLVATLTSAYPHVRVYRPTAPTLLFLASDAPIEPERNFAVTRAALAGAPDHYGRLGLNVVEDLAISLALDEQGSRAFGGDAPVITDDANRFAVASLFDTGTNLGGEAVGDVLAPYDPLLDARGLLRSELGPQLAFDYMARRLQEAARYDGSARSRLRQLARLFAGTDLQVYMEALLAADATQNVDAQRILIDGRRQHPDSVLLRDALLESVVRTVQYDGGTDAVARLAGQLGPADPVVLRAAQRAAHNDWTAVAALDAALEQVEWTSVWNTQAMRLRIQQRLRQNVIAAEPRLDADTIRMIDRLCVVQPDPQMYLLRALSAGMQPHYLMESMFRYSLAVLQGLVTRDADARNQFGVLQQRFNQLAQSDEINRNHYLEVKSVVDAVAGAN